MNKRLYLILFILSGLIPASLYAQYNIPENNVWVFNANNGIDFNGTTPVGVSSNMCTTCYAFIFGLSEVYAPGASVCDTSGHLLFYTDGSKVWRSNGQVMPNGNSLGPALFNWVYTNTPDGTVITGIPDSVNKYYVFSLTDGTTIYPGAKRLFYSVVDMQADTGNGAVVANRKWIPVDTGLSAKMVAVQGDNCNIWLIIHASDTNMFKAYEITWKGINPNPVVSYTGAVLESTLDKWDNGELTISPSRKKLVAAYGGSVELYDFDPATGIVANGWTVDTFGAPRNLNAACFSSDNSKLYITQFLYSPFDMYADCAINQLDLSQPTNAAIELSLNTVTGASLAPSFAEATTGELRLARDGKIYFFYSEGGAPGGFRTIEQPNLYGPACQANLPQNEIIASVTYGGVGNGMGNEFVKSAANLHPDTSAIVQLDTCIQMNDGEKVTLHVPQENFLAYTWDDNTTDSIRTITQPGTYWVTGIDRCQDVSIDTFTVKPVPSFSLGADTAVCTFPISLKTGVAGVSYLWSDNSTADSIQVLTPGVYWAKVSKNGCSYSDTTLITQIDVHQDLGKDQSVCRGDTVAISLSANVSAGADVLWSTGSTTPGIVATDTGTYWVSVTQQQCEGSDTVQIIGEKCDCRFGAPTAFTPNGDGRNDLFRLVLEPNCPVQSYLINIYNRWGQLVYTGTDPATGWNGTWDGQPQEIGTYMYTIDFSVGTQDNHYYQKGDVTLIR